MIRFIIFPALHVLHGNELCNSKGELFMVAQTTDFGLTKPFNYESIENLAIREEKHKIRTQNW